MQEQSITNKIVRNTVFNIIGLGWGVLIALVITPYIIRHIGIERYGIWAFVSVLTGYFGLLDFGFGYSFIKYISEFYARNDYEKINQLVNTGFVFYSVFALLILAVAVFTIRPLINLFNISSELYQEGRFVFLLGIIVFGIFNAISPFKAVQGGLQRMDISNKLLIAMSIPNVLGTILFLEKGYGLPGLMINNAIIVLITSIVNLIIAFRLLPTLRFNPFLFGKNMFKRLFGFGYKMQVSAVATLVHFQTDKILLAHFLNIGLVTFYAIAAQIASNVRAVLLLLISAIFPAASELEAKSDKASLNKLYFRSMKYIMLIGLPVTLLLILLSRPFIYLWLGKGFDRTVLTLQILMLGYFFNIISGPGFTILNGMGKPLYGMKASLLGASLNLFLSILLVIKMGYFGVVLGTAIALISASVYFIIIVHRVMEMPFWELFLKILPKPFLACSLPGAVIYILVKYVGRFEWFGLIGAAFFYLVSFVAIIVTTDYLDSFDKSLLNKYSPIPLFKIKEHR